MARISLLLLLVSFSSLSRAATNSGHDRSNSIHDHNPDDSKYEGILPPVIIPQLNNSVNSDGSDNEAKQTTAASERGQYPHQVSLRDKRNRGKVFCGASVIHPLLLLSAAHCFDKIKHSDIQAIAGDHSRLAADVYEQHRDVIHLILHDNWNNQTWENDIAILVLKEPLEFNETVGVIALGDSKWVSLPETAIVTGWGTANISVTHPHDKHMFTVTPILPPANCTASFGTLKNFNVTEGMICAEGKGEACTWDAGGPLMCNRTEMDGTKKRYLCGIASWGTSCTSKGNHPTVYVDVAKYERWIRKYMHTWWKHYWVSILAQPISEDGKCGSEKLTCSTTGLCLPQRYKCDGQKDCHPLHDDLDEQNCSSERIVCRGTMFSCNSTRKCIPRNYVCDGDDDCKDGSDEADCA